MKTKFQETVSQANEVIFDILWDSVDGFISFCRCHIIVAPALFSPLAWHLSTPSVVNNREAQEINEDEFELIDQITDKPSLTLSFK